LFVEKLQIASTESGLRISGMLCIYDPSYDHGADTRDQLADDHGKHVRTVEGHGEGEVPRSNSLPTPRRLPVG
jgi:hypothetical protein